MHRSSETIGAIATALAKAQAELTNPEKSLTGTIPPSKPGDRERSFRYAPLSSGLDIVRKTLGRYEIATVQTTSIDYDAGLIRLVTLLAHSSGEWVSSDWPVCHVNDVALPHRLGAALTYARRYAHFTLVGIAGEDDLDAPDLSNSQQIGGPVEASALRPNRREPRRAAAAARLTRSEKSTLSSDDPQSGEESEAARRRLEAELSGLSCEEDVLAWARRVLPTKNSLHHSDAQVLEEAFQQKINSLTPWHNAPTEDRHDGPPTSADPPTKSTAEDEAALALPKTRRLRDKRHLALVASKPCLVCGRTPSDAHHLRFSQPRALGTKVSDEFTVPLCRTHHRELHNHGNERSWWGHLGIDPMPVARQLWQEAH